MSSPTASLEESPTTASRADQPAMDCGGMPMSTPTSQHQWLRRFVGEWDGELEMYIQAGQPPQKTRAADSVHALGDFWVISEARNLDFPFQCHMALGYDIEIQKYVGLWVDSMGPRTTRYEGSVDASGNTLTLTAEIPFPPHGNKLTRFRDVTEFKSDDYRVFRSSMQLENGEWLNHLTIHFRRRR